MNPGVVQLDNQHKLFFQKVLTKASNTGFLKKSYRYDVGDVGCFSCCVLTTACCTPKDSKGCCVLAVIALALSFFVGLFFTISSSAAAASAKKDLRKVEIRMGQLNNNQILNQSESPEYLKQNVQLMNVKLNNLYQAAENFLEDYRAERSIAAFSQALMTAGCAIVIAALVINYLMYGQDTLCLALGVGGGATIVVGLFIWLKKRGMNLDDAKNCAGELKAAIDQGVMLNN